MPERQLSRLSLKNVLLVLITITLTWIVIKFSSSQAEVFEDDADIDSDKEASPIFKAFYKCVRPKLEPFRGRHNDVSLTMPQGDLRLPTVQVITKFDSTFSSLIW